MTDTPPTKRSSRRRVSIAPPLPAAEPVPAVPEPVPISAPVAAIPEVPTTPPPVVSQAVAAPSFTPSLPPQEPTLPNSPFRRHDVVQVLDTTSRHYGQFFMVGDVRHNKVHGYYLMPGSKKEHITVDLQHCWYVGAAKVRSATPCSPKWLSDGGVV